MCSVLGHGSGERLGLVSAREELRVWWGSRETPRPVQTKLNASPSAGKDRKGPERTASRASDEDTPLRASGKLPWGAEGGTGVPGVPGQGTESQAAGTAWAKACTGLGSATDGSLSGGCSREAGGRFSEPRPAAGDGARGAERVGAGGLQLSRHCGNICRHP